MLMLNVKTNTKPTTKKQIFITKTELFNTKYNFK